MNGTVLLETSQELLPANVIETAASELGVVVRERKLDVARLVASLVLSNGSDDIGVLAEAMRVYNSEADDPVVRGAFYVWLDDELALLMERLLRRALDRVAEAPLLLPGILGSAPSVRAIAAWGCSSTSATSAWRACASATSNACSTSRGSRRTGSHASWPSTAVTCRARSARRPISTSPSPTS